MSQANKAQNFVKGVIDSIQEDDIKLIQQQFEKLNSYFMKCDFKEDLGFLMEFTKYMTNESIKEKFGQLFNVDNHMCRVKINQFSDESKMHWQLVSSEVFISMSQKNISRLQDQFMELWMDKSALVHIEHHEKEEKNENQEQNLKEMKAEELLAEDNDGFVDI